jgi:hypothetical protein
MSSGVQMRLGQADKLRLSNEYFASLCELIVMDTRTRSDTITYPHCVKCRKQTKLVTSMLDSLSGKTVRIFECDCGDKTWITDH